MKIPLVDKALSVMSFLNGIGATIRVYEGISGTDMATLNRVNVR
jgi:hypothetical protein